MTKSPTRGSASTRCALFVAVMSILLSGVVATSAADAAGGQQIVMVNAVNGPAAVDVYLDGSLHAAVLAFGSATTASDLASTGDHDIELFESISNPSALSSDRSDEPLEAGRLVSQPDGATFAHPDGIIIARLANSTRDGQWYAFIHDVPVSPTLCAADLASRTFDGAADIFVRGPGGGGGSGIFGIGGGTHARGNAFTQSVVVQGGSLMGSGIPPSPYAFGSFNFGEVTFALGQNTMYLAVGNEGRYGVVEVIIDCNTMRFVSTRSVAPDPVFDPSTFVALEPTRLFDTRSPEPPSGVLGPGATIDVKVTGQAGVPATDVAAVVLNVTAANAAGRGFVTVWPKGARQPSTSNLNVLSAGQTVPNLVTVPVGDDGEVSFFSNSGTHLLGDVSGYFTEADIARAGRFVPVSPARVFDTRRAPAPNGAVAPEGSISVLVAGANDVPATGASAVVLNLTGIATGAGGFVTAWPSGTAQPKASNLNLSGPGNVAPNLVIVPLGADGGVDFFTSGGAHLFADVFGYFTDDSAANSTDGLFVPTSPARIYDSRPDDVGRGGAFIDADTTRTVAVAGNAGVPGVGASAVLANVTAAQAGGQGFMSVWPSGIAQPLASNLNLSFAGETRPNAVLVPLGSDGAVNVYSQSGAHALVDVFGYFTS